MGILTKSFILVSLLLVGCSNKAIIRETIITRGLKIEWYLESYITSTRDFITVTKEGKTETILDIASECVTDVWLVGDTIYIKMKPVAPYSQETSAFGYMIVLDKTATTDDWQRVYAPSLYQKKH